MHPWRLVRVPLGIAACAALVVLFGPPVSGDDEKGEPPAAGKPAEKRVALHFQTAPWKKVFEHLAEQTGLPVSAAEVPTGTFTFIPPAAARARTYTIPEAVDIVNDALMASNRLLVRRPTSLQLVAADERVDPALSPLISADELPRRGRTELVRILLPIKGIDPKEALAAVKSLQGPFGTALPLGGRLLLHDTAGNLRQIVRVVEQVDSGGSDGAASLTYKCAHILADKAKEALEQLLGTSSSTKKDDKLTILADMRTNSLHLRGPAERIAEAKVILSRLDIAGGEPLIVDGHGPELKVYTAPSGEAESLARTLQEAYRSSRTVRITSVGTDRILVYGTPNDQVAIARQILGVDQPLTIEVLPLVALDLEKTVELLRAMFPGRRGSGGVLIEADPKRSAVIVRGTREQIDEVKSALRALGEPATPAGGVRVIPLERGDAATLAAAIRDLLPKMRPNPVRVIEPGKQEPPAKKPAVPGKDGAAAKKEGGKAATVTLTPIGNRLVVSCDDPQALAVVQELVRVLTAPQEGELEVIRLRSANAIEAARIIDETFNGRPGATPGARRVERVRVVADAASNSLLVRAAPLDLVTIRRLVSKSLDVPSDSGEAVTRTYILGPLKHATASEVAAVLREVYGGGRQSAVTITSDPRTNSVILRCRQVIYEDARKLMEQLDSKAEKKE